MTNTAYLDLALEKMREELKLKDDEHYYLDLASEDVREVLELRGRRTLLPWAWPWRRLERSWS